MLSLRVLFCVSIFYAVTIMRALPAQNEPEFEPHKYLPRGAKIQDTRKNMIFADLDGDGLKEVVLFYTLDEGAGRHQANILVLRPKENTYVPIWKDDYEGSWGFIDPSGVRDITKSGKPFIIAYRSIGASCPGILRTFQYREGAIRPVPAEWDSHTCHSELQIKDLNGDGVMEIVFKPLRYGVNPDIYRWEGRRYVKSNTRFSSYYNPELENLLQDVNSTKPLPASARIMWAKQAVEILTLQKRYSEAIRLCNELLRIIDDPKLTSSNTTVQPDQTAKAKQEASLALEVERIREKAAIYRLLGDNYKSSGNQQEAENAYQKAKKLELEPQKRGSRIRQ